MSVVIPTRGRPAELRACLLRVAPGSQTLPSKDYEVIVTDDGRGDSARGMVEAEFPWVRWTEGPGLGPAANRNHGAKLANGEWLVFVDDDCLPDAGWLGGFAEAMQIGNVGLLEGRTICPDRTEHPLEEVVENPRGGNFWSCNLAVRRADFERLGGFDEDFREPAQEDAEFAHRARARGVAAGFVEGALVAHPARRLTLKQLWKRALMIRWFSLYLLKTRMGWAERKLVFVLPAVALERAANDARMNWRLLRELRRENAARIIFQVGWRGVTFPVLLPYILHWETRFRRESNSRIDGSACEVAAPV